MSIGLVLSGGGSRGIAHVGAIKALEEFGLFPTHISGSSVGAVVGSLYAYGYDWKDMLEFFKSVQILDIKKYAYRKPGLIDTEKFYKQFNAYLKEDNFNHLEKSLVITATDILKGILKTFNAGELIRPVLASAAFPGVFAPVKINNSYYIDGGTLNNFPVGLLKPQCDIIIGSYVNGFSPVTIKELKYSHNVMKRAFRLKYFKDDYAKFNDCTLVISSKKISKYGIFDKKHLDEIFTIGYDKAREVLTNQFILKQAASLKKAIN
ncbi:patatin-like phospholipase family protein [Tenacibaculum larymnensis]|uniref:Patatin-like phospholipase family protein n=1 Tax=Tenacibaculum larymnensis TaxID=2878201 RepID=A0A9X4EWE5_9FLAO|nr:patatin-like phospholipase family protein [Tenacibaculum larymnensis]MDE1207937.1 patatin-like phospholipase family protein [Tenacibaculum larymnensis]